MKEKYHGTNVLASAPDFVSNPKLDTIGLGKVRKHYTETLAWNVISCASLICNQTQTIVASVINE